MSDVKLVKLHGDAPSKITVLPKDGRVTMVFDRPAGWMALNPAEAIRMGQKLIELGNQLQQGQKPLILVPTGTVQPARIVAPFPRKES